MLNFLESTFCVRITLCVKEMPENERAYQGLPDYLQMHWDLPVAVQKLPFLLPFSCAQYSTKNLIKILYIAFNVHMNFVILYVFKVSHKLRNIEQCYLP